MKEGPDAGPEPGTWVWTPVAAYAQRPRRTGGKGAARRRGDRSALGASRCDGLALGGGLVGRLFSSEQPDVVRRRCRPETRHHAPRDARARPRTEVSLNAIDPGLVQSSTCSGRRQLGADPLPTPECRIGLGRVEFRRAAPLTKSTKPGPPDRGRGEIGAWRHHHSNEPIQRSAVRPIVLPWAPIPAPIVLVNPSSSADGLAGVVTYGSCPASVTALARPFGRGTRQLWLPARRRAVCCGHRRRPGTSRRRRPSHR